MPVEVEPLLEALATVLKIAFFLVIVGFLAMRSYEVVPNLWAIAPFMAVLSVFGIAVAAFLVFVLMFMSD